MRATRTTIYGADSQRMLDWATNSLHHFLEFPNAHTLAEVRNYVDTIEETMNPATPQENDQ